MIFFVPTWRVAVKGIGTLGYFAFARDSKSLVFDTQEVQDPYIYRLRKGDFTFAPIVSLKKANRFYGPFGAWSGVAPDGSPLFVRDISNQEIYALDWRLPDVSVVAQHFQVLPLWEDARGLKTSVASVVAQTYRQSNKNVRFVDSSCTATGGTPDSLVAC